MLASLCTSLTLGLTLGSYHFDRSSPYQEFNPGAYLSCDGWTGGVYKNSLGKTSAFAGKAWEFGPFSLAVGAVSGYSKPLMLMVFPSVKIKSVRVGFIPPIEPKEKGALTFSWEW